MNVQPFLIGAGWMHMLDGDASCRAIFDRHYSRYIYADGRRPKLFVGPGEKVVLMQADGLALCVWRKQEFTKDGQQGVNCSIYRNESPRHASDMLKDAMMIAWQRWGGSDCLPTWTRARCRQLWSAADLCGDGASTKPDGGIAE